MEAQRIKSEHQKNAKLEEEKGNVTFGAQQSEVNLDKFIKPEYLMASPYMDIKVPSKAEIRIAAHKQEATCLTFNTIGDAIATGGADSLVKLWSAANGKEI